MIQLGPVQVSFDAAAVADSAERATKRVLSTFGAYVRRTARRSIKKASGKHKISEPGEPPRSHVDLLRAFILFAFDPRSQSVVVGPAALNKPGNQPAVLEYGGTEPLFRRGKTVMGRYRARPTMQPALEKQLASGSLDKLWANSVRK